MRVNGIRIRRCLHDYAKCYASSACVEFYEIDVKSNAWIQIHVTESQAVASHQGRCAQPAEAEWWCCGIAKARTSSNFKLLLERELLR
jgi:hypothetical protein